MPLRTPYVSKSSAGWGQGRSPSRMSEVLRKFKVLYQKHNHNGSFPIDYEAGYIYISDQIIPSTCEGASGQEAGWAVYVLKLHPDSRKEHYLAPQPILPSASVRVLTPELERLRSRWRSLGLLIHQPTHFNIRLSHLHSDFIKPQHSQGIVNRDAQRPISKTLATSIRIIHHTSITSPTLLPLEPLFNVGIALDPGSISPLSSESPGSASVSAIRPRCRVLL